jgi:mRNA interferase MazF
VTSHAKGYSFEVPLPAGLVVSGVVLADHVKCLDWRSRRAEFAGAAPAEVVAEVVRRLGLLLGGITAKPGAAPEPAQDGDSGSS